MKDQKIFTFGYIFYAIAILTHILIIAQILPYTWINGGRSESYDAQLQLSIVNIGIAFIGIFYVFVCQKSQKLHGKRIFRIIKWIIVAFWIFSLVLQFLGTSFEMFVMAPIILFGIYAHVRLALLGLLGVDYIDGSKRKGESNEN